MAGAVARYVKSLWSAREGALNILAIIGLPVVGYIAYQQKKQLELAREYRMRNDALLRGMIRVEKQ